MALKREPLAVPRPFAAATVTDAEAIAELRSIVADELTRRHGRGWWSRQCTSQGVHSEMRVSQVYVRRIRREAVATFRLATRKPWAIDLAYFTPVERALYLHAIAVRPDRQRAGLGRQCLDAALAIARAWPAQAIRLDAFDHVAGAGEFYRRCGLREIGGTTYRKVPLIYFERLL